MDQKTPSSIVTTTFQMPHSLHTELKMMCILTGTSMGKFIRLSLRDKIKQLKDTKPNAAR